jgi:hypothetical protein
MEERQKTSIAMTPKVKLALERLKLKLRVAGVPRPSATEAAIVEALILTADFEGLRNYLDR